jgi:hypothetical protein
MYEDFALDVTVGNDKRLDRQVSPCRKNRRMPVHGRQPVRLKKELGIFSRVPLIRPRGDAARSPVTPQKRQSTSVIDASRGLSLSIRSKPRAANWHCREVAVR